jgi:hypothetical protein
MHSHMAAKNASSASLVECKTLSAALPRLKEIFAKVSNGDNIFPLFSPKVNELVWKTVEIDLERKAAVLVPLVSYEGVPSILFTTRSSNLPTHANEVSFPGGHFDESTDENFEDTAIREAQEELLGDYPWDMVQILGCATPLPSIRGTPVTPVVAILPFEISADTFPGEPGEVDEIFCVSLDDLIAMETSDYNERFRSKIPVFPAGENKNIWGLTAVITRPLLHKLFKPALLMEESLESSSKL